MCCVQNKWLYEPIGMERQVNEWLLHLRYLTWSSLKQLTKDYLQLAKTRWTVWDPRRGEFAFQVSTVFIECSDFYVSYYHAKR